MKTRFRVKGLTGLFLLLFMVVSCDKEEEGPPQFEAVSFDGQEVIDLLPAGLTSSDDEYAKECVSMIESALDMSTFMDGMEVPPDAQKTSKKGTSGTWSWGWNYMGQMWTFYWTYDEDNTKRYWTMEIQFGDGPRYDYISAWEMMDGSQGEVVYNFNWVAIYDGEEDYVDLYWKYTWRLDSAGDYYFSWYYDADDEEYDYYLMYDVIVKADGSGSVEYYFFDELYYQMLWDALGNGSWAYLFSGSNLSGTWTAG